MQWAEEFLNLYYWDDVLQLAGAWPDKQSLNINSNTLSRCDIEKWELLHEHPDQIISELEDGLKNTDLPIDIIDWHPTVRITGIENPIRVRDIRTEKINKLVTVTGIVQKISKVWPRITMAHFECARCGYVTVISQIGHRFAEPLECENEMCGRKGPFKLMVGLSEMVDTQKLRLQESPEDLNGGEQPQTIDVQIDGDITGDILPGNRVTITGILRAYQKTIKNNQKTTQFDMILDGGYVDINETESDIQITDEDMKQIQELSKKNNVVDLLVERFATTIYGYDVIKEALLAAAVSGDNIITPDGTILRGYIHVLTCGDPATAKSTLLRHVKNLIPRSNFTSGDGSTGAGLTAAAVKDDFGGGGWTLEAGAIALSDRSVALVDELDKMRDTDVSKLNTALSWSMIIINKAGINATLWARCPVLAAMNPKNGKFDRFEPIPPQVKISPYTMSRFDLIFTIEQRAGKNPVAPLIRSIISDWLGLDNIRHREQITDEIDKLTSQINILNKELKDVDAKEYQLKISADIEADRQEYLKSHPDVLEMYQNKSIGPKGYQLLQATLGFKNKDEVNRWLDEQYKATE